MTGTRELEALRAGRGFADFSGWRKVRCRGLDARQWLNDLLTAEIVDLRPGRARRALLLTPTGRIRADVTVAATEDGLLLLQDPVQPRAVHDLLAPYVLSSDVALDDETGSLALVAFPGDAPSAPERGWTSSPSCLGAGVDILGPTGTGETTRAAAMQAGLVEVGPEAIEAWRIERGSARFPVDLTADSLPHEAGLDRDIDPIKGCFLGQEAVAKVRNLGHPPFVILAGRAEGPVLAGETVTADGEAAGTVTSSGTAADSRTAVIIRVRWAARDRLLASASGERITTLDVASG